MSVFANFLIFLVLARLLGPEAYGLLALSMIVPALGELVLSRGGWNEALIQKSELDPAHLDSVFWLLVVLAGLLSPSEHADDEQRGSLIEAVIEDVDDLRIVRAEDDTGSFGIQPGHTDFVTVLPVSVVSWTAADGREGFVLVRRGVMGHGITSGPRSRSDERPRAFCRSASAAKSSP